MRRLFKILVLVMSIACVGEAGNDNELLKIHTIKLDGFPQELADTANEWLNRSTLGWRIVESEPADAALSLMVSFEDVIVMPVPETSGGCGFPRLTEDCEPHTWISDGRLYQACRWRHQAKPSCARECS